jgi:hypothetical protein
MLGNTTCLDDYSIKSSEQEEDVLHGGGSISKTSSGFSSRKKKEAHGVNVKVEKDNTSAFNDKYSALVDQGQMTLKHMKESANCEKARFQLEQELAIREKACFDLEQETANREQACFELYLNKDKFFASLEVAKAMNDYEEAACKIEERG